MRHKFALLFRQCHTFRNKKNVSEVPDLSILTHALRMQRSLSHFLSAPEKMLWADELVPGTKIFCSWLN